MKVAVSGAGGLIGSALTSRLAKEGHKVFQLVRVRPPQAEGKIYWNPQCGEIDAAGLEGMDAVVHLAGENIASGRWNEAQKARIRDSRVQGTRLLAETLAGLGKPPGVLASASAIGFYGDRGEDVMREDAAAGGGFLAEVCEAWEAAAQPASDGGIRVVNCRFGVVFSPDGGPLALMLPPFRMGVGGVIGGGRQYMSWVSIGDAVGALMHVLSDETLAGPVNIVAPRPVTNREFTKTLGRVLRRPTILPMPAFAARLAFGEMANDLLLASTRVEPQRLLDSGYSFQHPQLEAALRALLHRGAASGPRA